MSLNHLSLLLSAISVSLGLTGIVLTILFAIFGVLAGLIVLAFALGTAIGAAGTSCLFRYWITRR
jgi:hypothetical protein